MSPKNSGGSTKFPGGHKVIDRTAQTAFVRVVTPRVSRKPVVTLILLITIRWSHPIASPPYLICFQYLDHLRDFHCLFQDDEKSLG